MSLSAIGKRLVKLNKKCLNKHLQFPNVFLTTFKR